MRSSSYGRLGNYSNKSSYRMTGLTSRETERTPSILEFPISEKQNINIKRKQKKLIPYLNTKSYLQKINLLKEKVEKEESMKNQHLWKMSKFLGTNSKLNKMKEVAKDLRKNKKTETFRSEQIPEIFSQSGELNHKILRSKSHNKNLFSIKRNDLLESDNLERDDSSNSPKIPKIRTSLHKYFGIDK